MTRNSVVAALGVFVTNIPLACLCFIVGAPIAGYAMLLFGTAFIWAIACEVVSL